MSRPPFGGHGTSSSRAMSSVFDLVAMLCKVEIDLAKGEPGIFTERFRVLLAIFLSLRMLI